MFYTHTRGVSYFDLHEILSQHIAQPAKTFLSTVCLISHSMAGKVGYVHISRLLDNFGTDMNNINFIALLVYH